MSHSRNNLDYPPAASRGMMRMANLVILGMALLCMVAYLAAYFIGRTGLFRIVPLSMAVILLGCLWLPATMKVSLALCCFSSVFAFYAAEVIFHLLFDAAVHRTISEVVRQLRYPLSI